MKYTFLNNYEPKEEFIEEIVDNQYNVRGIYKEVLSKIDSVNQTDIRKIIEAYKRSSQELEENISDCNQDKDDQYKIFPFDLLPRIIDFKEWKYLERGFLQRSKALNLFITDVYNDQKIIKDKVVPGKLVYSAPHYLKVVEGNIPSKGIYNHISGYDLIRHADGSNYILEDNFRFPSGVSDALMSRKISKECFSSIFEKSDILSVHEYPQNLLKIMREISPSSKQIPFCVLLSEGPTSSVNYKHSFLAKELKIELVESKDLFVENEKVYLRKADRNIRVDVIYKRIGDESLDFLSNKFQVMSPIKSILNSYLKGNVSIINAPGSGIGDDKAIYAYVPKMIKYYLDEDAMIPNVKTFICARAKDLKYVLQNLSSLVVKPVDMFGGTGVKFCNALSTKELNVVKDQIRSNPRGYVAQPIMTLSTHLTYINESGNYEPRHIDLRSMVLLGDRTSHVYPGGLTRVAYQKGSLIVNTSQGGGFKDTWVIKPSKEV